MFFQFLGVNFDFSGYMWNTMENDNLCRTAQKCVELGIVFLKQTKKFVSFKILSFTGI